jgi:hypothetical protein
MPKFLIGRIVVILLFSLVFYFGIAALKSGEIRSRGYKVNRDENPLGYWFTVLISLVGPVAIIYLMLTRLCTPLPEMARQRTATLKVKPREL